MAVPTIGGGDFARDEVAREGVALVVQTANERLWMEKRGRGDFLRQAAPGSVLKPLVLSALMKMGLLRGGETFLCRGRLTIEGRQLNCVHPRLAIPMDPARAIAYSCNCAVAHWAARLNAYELESALRGVGLRADGSGHDVRLVALGEEGIRVSAEQLLRAYQQCEFPDAVRIGMEGAVEYGTAQRAALAHIRVAGKTGSGGTVSSGRVAWYAGFAPNRKPEIFVVVMAAGASGGADAAPWARDEMLYYFGERA